MPNRGEKLAPAPQGPSPAAQAWMTLMDANQHLRRHMERIHDQLMRVSEPQMARGVANEYATALAELLPKLDVVLPLADGERRKELRAALIRALAATEGFYDCDCVDREAIVTDDGMVCGSCGEPINPDPRLVTN